MGGLVEEILKNREEILLKLLEMLEGKEARAKVDLDGITFTVGQSKVALEGAVEFTFVPLDKKSKKK